MNMLPYDGIVEYFGSVFDRDTSEALLKQLLERVSWQHDKVILFGKKRILSRKVAWHGGGDFTYAYSGTCKQAAPWTPTLRKILERVESSGSAPFNSCLLNLYLNGAEGMGWHSDDETTLGRNPEIASVSFGAERVFKLKHRRTGEVVSILLEHGSLPIMKGETQHHYIYICQRPKKAHSLGSI